MATLLRSRLAALASLCCAILLPQLAFSIDWTVTPSIEIRGTYTDNLTLVPAGEETEESVVGFVPGIIVLGETRRSVLALSADLQYQRFVETEDDDFSPTLSLAGTTTLIEQLLFLSANVSTTEASVDNTQLLDTTLLSSEELSRTHSYNISPNLVYAINPLTSLNISYTASGQLVDETTDEAIDGDSRNQSLEADIAGSPRDSGYAWGFNASDQRTRNDNGSSGNLQAIQGRIGKLVTNDLSLVAALGSEWVDSTGTNINTRIDDRFTIWDIGVDWRPNAALAVQLGYGERAFGRSPRANLILFGRRSDLQLSWDREYTTFDSTLSDTPTVGSASTDNVATTELDQLNLNAGNSLSLSRGLSVDERISLSLRVPGRLSEITLGGSYLQRTDFNATEKTEFWSTRAAISRRFGRGISMQLSYEHNEQLKNNSVAGYAENQIEYTLGYSF